MEIIVANARSSISSHERKFPGAAIVNLTSKAPDEFVKLSPFYPHEDIPVPLSPSYLSCSVEGIWQGLKVFENHSIDTSKFEIRSMKGLKRTERRFGKILGHKNGVDGCELLGYVDAKKSIYLPSYEWVMRHRVSYLIDRLMAIATLKTLVLLDYETSLDVLSPTEPISHAAICRNELLRRHSRYPQ